MLIPVADQKFEPLTYRELGEKVRAYAGALRAHGAQRGDRIAIQADNCAEWAFVDWACHTLGVILVPIYPTLPADQAQYIAKDCEAAFVIVGAGHETKMDGAGLRVVPLTELGTSPTPMPSDEWEAEIAKQEPEDVVTFIYTSGTTGNPKGAMLTSRSILHVANAASEAVHFTSDDTFLTFLPMSHVFERVAGQALPVYVGATIAFAKSIVSLAKDLVVVKPTVLLCVPRFLEATKDRILDAAAKGSGVQRFLFDLAYKQGLAKVDGKFAPLAGVLDGLVGKKIREKTGGRIRFFVSGGAALPDHVARFYLAFNMTVLQGYGLTETSAGTCINLPENNKYWTVGPDLDMEVKIAGDGEVLVRGAGLMTGYYNLPEETANAIDPEGWFHTGDIGEFEGTSLKITDRKKDIIVLANGKNVAPQQIENMLKESQLINEVALIGDGLEHLYGLVVPNTERLRGLLAHAPKSDEELVKMPEAVSLVKAEIQKVNSQLADFQKLKKYALLHQQFSIETGELTPSLKVRRKVVKEKYAQVLAELTGRPE